MDIDKTIQEKAAEKEAEIAAKMEAKAKEEAKEAAKKAREEESRIIAQAVSDNDKKEDQLWSLEDFSLNQTYYS